MTWKILSFPLQQVINNQNVSPVEIDAGDFGENIVCPEFFSPEIPKFLEANSQLVSQILQKVHKQIIKNYHLKLYLLISLLLFDNNGQ